LKKPWPHLNNRDQNIIGLQRCFSAPDLGGRRNCSRSPGGSAIGRATIRKPAAVYEVDSVGWWKNSAPSQSSTELGGENSCGQTNFTIGSRGESRRGIDLDAEIARFPRQGRSPGGSHFPMPTAFSTPAHWHAFMKKLGRQALPIPVSSASWPLNSLQQACASTTNSRHCNSRAAP